MRKISVNGQIVTDMGVRITPGVDQVSVDGKLVVDKAPPKVYWMLNKPDMVLTSRDSQGTGRETIYDLPRLRKLNFLVSPVGRLDFRTEGLLLLSNDGEFVQRVSHPRYKVPRHYLALIKGKLSDSQLNQLRDGIDLKDGPVKGVKIQYAHGKNLGRSRGSWYFVTVQEGRNRLVRRLFEHFDSEVIRLIRYGIGDLRMPEDLKPGEYLQLSPQQVDGLRQDR